jgi:hypothetical protein
MTERDDTEKKPGLVQKSLGLLDSAVSSIKGQDINNLVERYTEEVTLVLEGSSEDFHHLNERQTSVDARMTILEEAVRSQLSDLAEENLRLQKRVETLQTKAKKDSALNKLVWIVGVFCSAWVITALLKFFGG